MHISNQQPSSQTQSIEGLAGKKPKKEGVMDALMNLGELPKNKKGGKNERKGAAFDHVATQLLEKKSTSSDSLLLEYPKKPIKAKGNELPISEKTLERGLEKKTKQVWVETNVETKYENQFKTVKKETKEELALHEPKEMNLLHLIEGQRFTPASPTKKEKKETDVTIQSIISSQSSHQQAKNTMSLTDIKQEQQVHILRDLARQLSDAALKSKPETFAMTEQTTKAKSTMIQLPIGETNLKKTTDLSPLQPAIQPKDMKKIKEHEQIKIDGLSVEAKTESSQRNEPMKTEGVRDIRQLITKEIEQYVELKEMNSKKVTMTIRNEELGNLDVRIEKKDDKIYILLKVEDGPSKEKMEQTLEQLKNELKDKNIDVEYEVEKEGEQKEKRKEQQELTEKESKRENQSEESDRKKFDEYMEADL